MNIIKFIFVGCVCFFILFNIFPSDATAPVSLKDQMSKVGKQTCSTSSKNNNVDNTLYTYRNEVNFLVIELCERATLDNATLTVYPSAGNKYFATALESENSWHIKVNEGEGKLTFYGASNTEVKTSFQLEDNDIIIKLNAGAYLTNKLRFQLTKKSEVEEQIKKQQDNSVVYPLLNQWDAMKKKTYIDELKKAKGTYQTWLKKKTYSSDWLASQEKALQKQTKKITDEGKTVKWLFQRALTNKENALTTLHSSNSYEEIVTNENYLQYEQDVTAFTIHYKEYRRQMDVLKNQKRILETIVASGEATQIEKNKLNPVISKYNEAIKNLTVSKDMFYKMLGALTEDVAKELETKT